MKIWKLHESQYLRYLRVFPRSDFLKRCIIFCMNCAEQPIPNQRVQPVVAGGVLVVHIVIHRRIYPPPQPMCAEALWVQFKSQMPVGIVQRHQAQPYSNHVDCVRNGEGDNGKNQKFR